MWEKVKLDNYVSILSGFAFKSTLFTDDSNHIPIIRIRDIKRSYTDTFYTGSYKEEYIIKSGDFIIGMDGEFNIAEWKGIPSLLNQRVCKISTLDKSILSERYLFYIISIYLKKIEDKTSFVTVKHLSVKDIKEIEIPFPPLHIQEKIAEILDKADELRRKDQELQAKYDQLAQAIFIDMFGDPVKNEKGWEVKKLEAVCTKITDGEHGTVERVEKGKLYLMARNISRYNSIDFSELSYISESDYIKINKRCNPEAGDILLVCVGATIGKLCIVPPNLEFSLARSVALLKICSNFINNNFLLNLLNIESIMNNMKSGSNSSAQAGLYLSKIKSFEIIVPPIHLQEEFAKKVEIINQLKAQTNAEKSEELFQSLLQKAFKGELVS